MHSNKNNKALLTGIPGNIKEFGLKVSARGSSFRQEQAASVC